MAKRVSEPFGTVTARDSHSLVTPWRRGDQPRERGPQATKVDLAMGIVDEATARASLAHHGLDLYDVLFRMLVPREQLRAQSFPDLYAVTGNVGDQTMQAGNAVSANVAQWLGNAAAAVLV
jgi:DNA (cytosine-5)-methyltransferase 1